MYSILAIILGMLISIMLTLNGQLEGYVGSTHAIIIIHIVGIIGVILIMLFKKEKIKLDKDIPLYLYSAGAVGVALTLINIATTVTIGVALTTALAVFGQLIFSSLVDHFGLFGMEKYKFDKRKLIGFTIILAGLMIMNI